MKTLNVGKILFLLMIVVGLSSCGDEYYTDDYLRNSDEKLCSKIWVEEYETDNNEVCEHYLEFSRMVVVKKPLSIIRKMGVNLMRVLTVLIGLG